jgi:hypothetical protein
MPRYLTPIEWDAAFSTLEEQGFVIIPSYFEGEQLEAMAAAQRRVLPTWEELRQDLPEGFEGTLTCDWPYSELILNKTGAQQPELVDFAKRWLGTEDIQIRVGIGLARYPGFNGKEQGVHVGTCIALCITRHVATHRNHALIMTHNSSQSICQLFSFNILIATKVRDLTAAPHRQRQQLFAPHA